MYYFIPPLLELTGGPSAYDNETFTTKRNSFPLFNSYGHPVPLVAGQQQADPLLLQINNTTPKVISTSFTDQIDVMRMDMTLAYPAAVTLQNLERSFTLSRPPNAYVIIQVSNQVASTVHSLSVPGQCYLLMHIPVLNFGYQNSVHHTSVSLNECYYSNFCFQDSVIMSSPGAFETALTAVTGGYEINSSPAGMSNWTSTGTNTGCFQQSGSVDKLCVTITSSHPFSVVPENLVFTSFSPMKGAKKWTRVAVRISQDVTSAWIKVVYYDPANPPTGL